jgi:hypothetical protein
MKGAGTVFIVDEATKQLQGATETPLRQKLLV